MKLLREPPKSLDKTNELTYDIYQKLVDNYTKDEEFNNHVKGKRLVLVGPSPSLEGTGSGVEIDSNDLVVRVNKGYPVTSDISKDIGQRTDIHYHCFYESAKCGGPIYYDQMIKDNIYVCCPYPKGVDPFHQDIVRFEKNKKSLKSHFIDTILYLECASLMHTRPNSGIGAILDLMAHDIESLYVTGFTFFKDGWRKTYKNENVMEKNWKSAQFSGTHAQQPQMDVCKELYNDPRLEFDNPMKKVLGMRYEL